MGGEEYAERRGVGRGCRRCASFAGQLLQRRLHCLLLASLLVTDLGSPPPGSTKRASGCAASAADGVAILVIAARAGSVAGMPSPCGLALLLLAILAGCADSTPDGFQGYAEGEFVSVAPAVAGRLDHLAVKRGDGVAPGAPLFTLESAREAAGLREAEAKLAAAEALLVDLKAARQLPEQAVTSAQLDQALVDERRSVTTLERDEAQFRVGGISAAQLDEVRLLRQSAAARVAQLQHELEVARLPGRVAQVEAQTAQVSAARAALERARWELDQKSVAATRGGRVHDTTHREGDWVAAGAVVVRLLPPENIKVRFFVPQAVAAGLAPGRAVLIRGVGADLPAKVDFVSTEAEFTPPVIYSNETSSKLVFMAEARPDAGAATRLQPGQPLRVLLQ